MRSPSVKTLTEAFRDLSATDARLIKRIAKATDAPEALRKLIDERCPKTADYVRSMYSDPYNSHMWRVTVALHAVNGILGTHGVEGLGPEVSGIAPPPYEYLNAGDTYATTLIYTRKTDTLRVGCWGDIAERFPENA
jgi:hypothetical protein